jgi:predicted SAM-dependent methyltransferase
METIKNCPLCGSKTFSQILKCVDFTVSKLEFRLQQCDNCTFVITSPRPIKGEIGQYYESEEYVSHSDTKKGFINSVYQLVKTHTIKSKVRMVQQLGTSNKILDIGCGTGSFLGACKKQGWVVNGVEPNNTARQNSIINYNFEPKSDFRKEEYEKEGFGIITMWHVLEHIHDLEEYLTGIAELLEEQGKLIVALPNLNSYDSKYYKEYWAAYDVPRHLWHFTPLTIKKLCTQYGLELYTTKPMWFDSFYVSMLSEKNKSGGNIVKAFLIGLISNINAIFKKGVCSSQIYVFVKK